MLKTYGISSIFLIRDVSMFWRSRLNEAGSLERVFYKYGDFVTTVILNNNYLGAIFVNFGRVWSFMSGSRENLECRIATREKWWFCDLAGEIIDQCCLSWKMTRLGGQFWSLGADTYTVPCKFTCMLSDDVHCF